MPDGQSEWEKERAEDEGLARITVRPSTVNGVTFPVDLRSANASANPIAVFPVLNFLTAEDEREYIADL